MLWKYYLVVEDGSFLLCKSAFPQQQQGIIRHFRPKEKHPTASWWFSRVLAWAVRMFGVSTSEVNQDYIQNPQLLFRTSKASYFVFSQYSLFVITAVSPDKALSAWESELRVPEIRKTHQHNCILSHRNLLTCSFSLVEFHLPPPDSVCIFRKSGLIDNYLFMLRGVKA